MYNVLSYFRKYLRKSTIVQICRKYKFVDNITVHALYSSVLSKVPYFRKYESTKVPSYIINMYFRTTCTVHVV